MKTSFVILCVVVATSCLWGQSQTSADPNYESVQVGMQTGALFNQAEVIPLVQFNFASYSRLHWGLYLDPSIGLEGRYGHQILGSIHYIISGGLQYTVAGRSAILVGYTWGGRYDGIQFSDPINRKYRGPWVGFRWNFPDGLLTEHGNLSIMGKWLPLTLQDREAGGWGNEYHQVFVSLTVAFNCDLH